MKTEETTLDKIRSRPRFKMYTQLSNEEYANNLKKYLAENAQEFEGNINQEMATICVKSSENNYWKPQLSLRIEKDEELESTVIRGVFGPSSAVWTFFMFLYFLWLVLWMTFITMWFVEKQIKSNEYPWALTASFIMIIMLGLTYLASQIGQIKAKSEMLKLRKFAEESTLPFETHANL